MSEKQVEALPDSVTKRRYRLEAADRVAFRRKVADLGDSLDELPEERQLLLFELEDWMREETA